MNNLSADELMDQENHAWPELKALMDQGENTYTYVPAKPEMGKNTLHQLQVSTRSYLGAVAYETEGMVVDYGWITLLGAGGESVYGSLASWNGLSAEPAVEALPGMMVVAYDVAGGFLLWIPGSSMARDRFIILHRMPWSGNQQSSRTPSL